MVGILSSRRNRRRNSFLCASPDSHSQYQDVVSNLAKTASFKNVLNSLLAKHAIVWSCTQWQHCEINDTSSSVSFALGEGPSLTLRLLMSYIYIYMELLVKPDMLTSYIYGPTLGNAETVSFYLLHNVSTLNQCREFCCVTFVCKHFAS